VVEIDEFAVFLMLYHPTYVSDIRSILLYIMTTTRSGFLPTPLSMTLNDLDRLIHLEMRVADDMPDVCTCMLWLSELRPCVTE